MAKDTLNVRNALICLWLFAIWVGERLVFQRALEVCLWDNWERWVSMMLENVGHQR